MTPLSASIDQLAKLVETLPLFLSDVQLAVRGVIEYGAQATRQEREAELPRLAALLTQAKLLSASLIAIGCGALIEQGADPAIAGAAILLRTREALARAPAFGLVCQEEARDHPGTCDPDDLAACVQHFGQQVAQRLPQEAEAWMASELLGTAALAVLMRLPEARQSVREDGEFLAALATYPGHQHSMECLRDVLQVLENEEVIVLHPALTRGYRVRLNGIGRNFELHTLLADALIGDPHKGWLPGRRPDPRVVAAAKDGPFPMPGEDAQGFSAAEGIFNLWNWQGLQPDGTLPGGYNGREHWIWNEGKPADIEPFEGTRVILLGPPPYTRSWNAGRYFPAMRGEVTVLEQLSAAQVEEWLTRIRTAVVTLNLQQG